MCRMLGDSNRATGPVPSGPAVRCAGDGSLVSPSPAARPLTLSHGRDRWGFLRSSYGISIATVLLFACTLAVQPHALSPSALNGMFPFAAILVLVALGQTLVVQQGGIDLSVPGMVSLSGVIVSYYSSSEPGMGDSGMWVAIVYTVCAGLLAGSINWLFVSRARVAPIVATLGMNSLLYGIDVDISGGTPVQVPAALSNFVSSSFLGVPTLVYIAVGTTALVTFLVKKTVFGRRFEAVGANGGAARAAGIVASDYQLAAYAGAALLYSLAGIFLAGLMQLPSAFQGNSYLMPSIAAVVLGGTSLFGGRGNLVAAAIAALFLTQLQQLVLTTGSSVGVQYLFQGGAIIVGVWVYSVKWHRLRRLFRRLAKRSLAPAGADGHCC